MWCYFDHRFKILKRLHFKYIYWMRFYFSMEFVWFTCKKKKELLHRINYYVDSFDCPEMWILLICVQLLVYTTLYQNLVSVCLHYFIYIEESGDTVWLLSSSVKKKCYVIIWIVQQRKNIGWFSTIPFWSFAGFMIMWCGIWSNHIISSDWARRSPGTASVAIIWNT